MPGRPLSYTQISELADVSLSEVTRDVRRGLLPSQEPEVVREWLEMKWARKHRYMPEVSDGSSTEF